MGWGGGVGISDSGRIVGYKPGLAKVSRREILYHNTTGDGTRQSFEPHLVRSSAIYNSHHLHSGRSWSWCKAIVLYLISVNTNWNVNRSGIPFPSPLPPKK